MARALPLCKRRVARSPLLIIAFVIVESKVSQRREEGIGWVFRRGIVAETGDGCRRRVRPILSYREEPGCKIDRLARVSRGMHVSVRGFRVSLNACSKVSEYTGKHTCACLEKRVCSNILGSICARA